MIGSTTTLKKYYVRILEDVSKMGTCLEYNLQLKTLKVLGYTTVYSLYKITIKPLNTFVITRRKTTYIFPKYYSNSLKLRELNLFFYISNTLGQSQLGIPFCAGSNSKCWSQSWNEVYEEANDGMPL